MITRPLIEWLLLRFPDTPKSRAKQWIAAGRVTVHGNVMRRPQEVIADPADALSLASRHATTLDCGAGWRIHPSVTLVHLDASVAVVNKGAGLISVPAVDAKISALSILEDFLVGRLKPRDRSVASRTIPAAYRNLTPLPVHRLDQYTTGLFCMGMNSAARQNLIEQVKTRTMHREYVAFAEGRSEKRQGTWRDTVQLSRDGLRQLVLTKAQARTAGDDIQEAITHYEVLIEYRLKDGRVVTKLKLRLETGRKHQIRAQAANAGLPLIGDRIYNPACRNPELTPRAIAFERQALHAFSLSLQHPDDPGKRMNWTAELPKDVRQLEHALRSGSAP